MKIDHICIAVRNTEKTAGRYCKLFGYHIKTSPVRNTRQDVIVQFLEKEDSLDIKLIQPGSKCSNLINFLKTGEGLHHICFKTDNVINTVSELEKNNARILAQPEPGEAFDNELIAFLYAGHGLNVEVIDTDKRQNLINSDD